MINTWYQKFAEHLSDKKTIERNKKRLENLKQILVDLSKVVYMSQGSSYRKLKELLDDPLVKGRKRIREKLETAVLGENNQKLALDSPFAVERALRETIDLVDKEISKEAKDLKKILKEEQEKKDREMEEEDN